MEHPLEPLACEMVILHSFTMWIKIMIKGITQRNPKQSLTNG